MTDSTPTPADKDRQRRAQAVVVTPPEGKWANPRPFGMGRHTQRFLHRATGDVVLAKSTKAKPWEGRPERKARRKAAKLARRKNRG